MLDLHISHHNAAFIGGENAVLDEKGRLLSSVLPDCNESSTFSRAEHYTSAQAQGAGGPPIKQ